MIEYPDALQVVDFSDQKLQLISVKIRSSNVPLVGPPLKSLSNYLPNVDVEIAAIFRQGNPIIPSGSTCLEPGDEVLFLANKTDSRQILSNLISISSPNQRVIIAGGGNIGTRLASTLEKNFQIKIIEKNHSRVESLATHITSGIVLQGDASDKELLLSENIENTDVFCAVTNRDETNIMAALLAKRLGAHKVMALVNRPSYIDLVEGGEIDILISPQQVTIGSLLTHVRRGHIVNVHALHKGSAEAIEMIVEGNKKSSKIIGKRIKDIPLPREANIIAIVRGNKTFMGHLNVIVEAGDRVIILLLDKRKIRQVERLFQEGLSIFI
jgi:trk system potassium uptake protein TrkA